MHSIVRMKWDKIPHCPYASPKTDHGPLTPASTFSQYMGWAMRRGHKVEVGSKCNNNIIGDSENGPVFQFQLSTPCMLHCSDRGHRMGFWSRWNWSSLDDRWLLGLSQIIPGNHISR